jgi:putative transposase
MKARFTDEQIIHCPAGYCAAMSREGDQLCDVLQIQIEVWRDALHDRVSRSDVPRVEPSDAKRLRALEDENGKLKKLLAEQMLDNAMLRDINSKNGDACWEAASGGSFVQDARCEPTAGV